MSDSTTPETLPDNTLPPSDISSSPKEDATDANSTVAKKTSKKATKKAASKKTAKKATKKVAKKVTAKKATKKTTKKVAAKKTTTKKVAKKTASTQEELPLFSEKKSTEPAKESSSEDSTHSKPLKKAPEDSQPVSSPKSPTEQTTEPVRGRVKGEGLGRIQKNKTTSSEKQSSSEVMENVSSIQKTEQKISQTAGSANSNENYSSDNRDENNRNEKRRSNRNDNRRNNNRRNGRRDNNQENNQDRRQGRNSKNNNRQDRNQRNPKRERERKPIVFTGDPVEVNGMLELAPKGFGFLRVPEKKFEQSKEDAFVPPDIIRTHGLRAGVWVHGIAQLGPRGMQLTKLETINGLLPAEAFKLPHFEELKAVNPTRRIAFETSPDRYTTRVLDIIAPVGRGQRGLIVSPPRSGKTTLLLHIAEAIQEKYDESIHLIILLIDERPEEVTEFRRMLPNAEIYASSNDDPARNHARIAELCIERAKRLVEADKDVLILMDSITRLARAYNNGSGSSHKNKRKNKNRGYQSGGIVAGALEMPRRIFAAARDTRTAGSLTILATALIQTNSRADEAIFQEFKGTGNMELVLDRKIAEQYIYPAVDIFKSGTRREELIMAEHLLSKINLIRRGLAGHRPEEAMERLLFFLKRFPNNTQMLMEIKG